MKKPRTGEVRGSVWEEPRSWGLHRLRFQWQNAAASERFPRSRTPLDARVGVPSRHREAPHRGMVRGFALSDSAEVVSLRRLQMSNTGNANLAPADTKEPRRRGPGRPTVESRALAGRHDYWFRTCRVRIVRSHCGDGGEISRAILEATIRL